MKPLFYAAALCLVAVPVMVAAPAKTDAKTKIVGVWQVVKSDEKVPPGTTMEFTKEGKAKVTLTQDGKRISLNGTYVIEGDKLTLRTKFADGEEVSEIATVTRLTDKELHFKDPKDKKTELKRKKGK